MIPLLIILILVTALNLLAVRPLVKGQDNQRLVWLPLVCLLVMADLLIALPITIWPGHLITTAISLGFTTWYLTASIYLWLTWWYHQTPPSITADYLIVLGAHVHADGPSKTLARRLQTALAFYHSQSPRPKIVLTGGQGNDEPQSEAAVMAAYLKRHHVGPQHLLLEQSATSTATNFKFSKQLITQNWHGDRQPKILVVTSDYHLVRSQLLAKQQHLPVSLLGSWTTTESLMAAMLREIAALLLLLKWPLIIMWMLLSILVQAVMY